MYCLYSFEYLLCGLFEGISLNFMFLSFNLKFIINCHVFILSFLKREVVMDAFVICMRLIVFLLVGKAGEDAI